MKNAKHKSVTFSAEEMAYELPADIDVRKLRHVGSGSSTVQRLIERSRRTVGLDPDVAKVFKDSESVNKALRALISIVPTPKPKRRSRRAA